MGLSLGKFQKGLQSGTVDLLSELDMQQKSQWGMLLIGSLLSTTFDLIISKLFVQNVTIPAYGVEYERVHGNQHPKTVMWPESVTMTFLDDALGTSRRFVNFWLADMYVPYRFLLEGGVNDQGRNIFSPGYEVKGKVWRDDQAGSKKLARLVPDNAFSLGGGLGGVSPPFVLRGLRPMSLGESSWDYASTDDQRIEATFAVDSVEVPFLF